MANWLVTVNYDEFDLEKAFDALPEIYWKNSATTEGKGLQINDIVYVKAFWKVVVSVYS
jgi:5-methylcytosine-specific restriction protein A